MLPSVPSLLFKTAVRNHGVISFTCRSAHMEIVQGVQGIITKPKLQDHIKCDVLIVGGGTAGCTVAAKARGNFEPNDIIILEPSIHHYYQPMWTLVGGGLKTLEDSRKHTKKVIPQGVKWIQDVATSFQPEENSVSTSKGQMIHYDYLVIATGIETRFDLVPGLIPALETPQSGVCSNYSSKYVSKTFKTLLQFKSGNAVFTFPNTPVKCAGAPQKICYLVEDFFKRRRMREQANVKYFAATPVLFSCKKYADELHKVCARRNIQVNLRHNLKEVLPGSKVAVFELLDKPGKTIQVPYSMLHVTPPMAPPAVLKTGPMLTDAAGFVNVNKETLQHVHYPNIFALGDCSNLPTSKTAAAAAAQSKILWSNLFAILAKKPIQAKYDGYTSCPLVTGYNSLILAEFDYNLQPLETFPFDQSKERQSMFFMKKKILPAVYWYLMLKGLWNGPEMFRKFFHPFQTLMNRNKNSILRSKTEK